jgi:hypothetical protein
MGDFSFHGTFGGDPGPDNRSDEEIEESERSLQDLYPHHFFPNECGLCGEAWRDRHHPLTKAFEYIRENISDIPTAELDHIRWTIDWFIGETLFNELANREAWRDRYHLGWREEHGISE